jgi:hypothetical protein
MHDMGDRSRPRTRLPKGEVLTEALEGLIVETNLTQFTGVILGSQYLEDKFSSQHLHSTGYSGRVFVRCSARVVSGVSGVSDTNEPLLERNQYRTLELPSLRLLSGPRL